MFVGRLDRESLWPWTLQCEKPNGTLDCHLLDLEELLSVMGWFQGSTSMSRAASENIHGSDDVC